MFWYSVHVGYSKRKNESFFQTQALGGYGLTHDSRLDDDDDDDEDDDDDDDNDNKLITTNK